MLMKTPANGPQALPGFVRAAGGVRVAIGRTERGSAPLTIAESGGYRVRFPRAAGACEGVLINTGGGMAGGARAVLTTQAAEKLYRSDGPDTEIAVDIALGPGSRLDWLPQEQILFDGARLRRRLDVELAASAALTLVESVVFGRIAMGEVAESGSFRDRWRIRRAGRLVFAEDVRLEGRLRETLARTAVGAGGRALATVL